MVTVSRISIVVLITLACAESQSKAACVDPTSCYCTLAQRDCEALIYAEVTESTNEHVSLRVIGEPPNNPDNIFTPGQIIEDVEFSLYTPSDLGVGWTGLFSIRPEGVCDQSQTSIYFFVAEEIDGLYMCIDVPEFPGVTRAELIPAVLDDNCSMIVREWGIESKCGTYSSGCCGFSETIMATENGLYIVLAGVFLVPGRRRRRKRK
jgi:hypothetical protein